MLTDFYNICTELICNNTFIDLPTSSKYLLLHYQ